MNPTLEQVVEGDELSELNDCASRGPSEAGPLSSGEGEPDNSAQVIQSTQQFLLMISTLPLSVAFV